MKVFSDFDVGEEYSYTGRTVTHADIRMWIGATDGTHPNHVNREYCEDHPVFDDIVAPGLLTLSIADGFAAREVAMQAAYALNYGHESVRYLEPVYVGDTISGELELVAKDELNSTWGIVTLDVEMSNQNDEVVLTERQQLLIARSESVDGDAS